MALLFMPAQAANATVYSYGYCNCTGTNQATTMSTSKGTVTHQIGPGVGYYEMTWQNGATLYFRSMQIGSNRASWANIIVTNPTYRYWGCAGPGY